MDEDEEIRINSLLRSFKRVSTPEGMVNSFSATSTTCSKTSTVCALIILVTSYALPTAMIVIGVIYIDSCPVERLIPIYLIVGGACSICLSFILVINLIRLKKLRAENRDAQLSACDPLNLLRSLIVLFLGAWVIAGSVWVFKYTYPDMKNPLSPNYCQETVYLFAFGTLIASWVLSGIILILACCCGCCLAACIEDSSYERI